jgi:hypothetical protein
MKIYGKDDHDELFIIKTCERTGEQTKHYKSNTSLCSCHACSELRQPKKRKLGSVVYPKGLVGIFKGDKDKTEKK